MEPDQLRNVAVTFSGRVHDTVTTQQGVQGDGRPPAGVWGDPRSLPSFSSAVADGMNMVTEELRQQNARRSS